MELARKRNKPLSLLTLVMINVIAIDSLRNLPGNAQTGYHIIFYYAICALAFLLPCVLITAQLASHYPKRGGVYIWVREAFGVRAAFLTIWLQWILQCRLVLTKPDVFMPVLLIMVAIANKPITMLIM